MDLSHVQIVSAFSCLVLAFSLILSPFKDRRFVAYNVARKLLIASQLLLFVQFVIQFAFHIRQNNPDLGAAVNHFFYIPASVLIYWSMLLCLRGKRVDNLNIISGVVLWLVDAAILVAGLLYKQGTELHHFNAASFILAVLMISFYTVYINLSIRKVKKEIAEYYANPVSAYVSWMTTATFALVCVSAFAFFATFDGRWIFLSGATYWFAMSYYVLRFDHFGYYVHSIMEAIHESETEAAAPKEVQPAEKPDPHYMEGEEEEDAAIILPPDRVRRLDTWVEEKGFCSNGVSIIELAGLIGTNRTSLSQYINSAKGMSFRDWINQLRCEDAKHMLSTDPSLPIDDVADRCGFSSRKYFDQVFCAYVGRTPAAFRDAHRL